MFRFVLLLLVVSVSACQSTQMVNAQSSCISLENCVVSISNRVHQNAKWICDIKSNDKVVKINAFVNRVGQLESTEMIQPSTDEEFNEAALKAVRDSAPFTEFKQLSENEYLDASDIIFTFVGNKTND